jgi:hypothetical protein
MKRDDVVREIDRLEAEAQSLRKALKRLDAHARTLGADTTTSRVLALLEGRGGDVMTLTGALAALGDPDLDGYSAVASALHSLAKRGLAVRVRQGVYRAAFPRPKGDGK